MKRDNWRFEALARAKIVRQEEEAKTMLLETCREVAEGLLRDVSNYPDGNFPSTKRFVNRANRLQQAIAKAEGKE